MSNKPMNGDKIPFVWSTDDISPGLAPELGRQLEFLDSLGIPGTFFVVPFRSTDTIDGDEELLSMMRNARERGHEFQQHGTRHDAFECGVPETWMLDFSPPTRRRFDEDRLEIEKGHTLEALTRMLDEGRRVWRAAFGEDPTGFRPGWGAFCGNFYRALDALGYRWVSSRVVSTTSWLWNQGLWDAPMEFRENVPWKPERLPDSALWEIPMSGGDYAFKVPNKPEKIEAMVDLGFREFEKCREQGIPFVMVCHWHGLERNDNSGYEVHRRLLPRIAESGNAEFMTLSALVDKLGSSTE